MAEGLVGKITAKMQPTVFFASAALVVGFCAFGGGFTSTAARVFGASKQMIVHTFGWYYVLIATGFLIFAVYLAASRFGRIRLGGNDAKPEFSTLTWFVMMFSAGMGTGLVFWSVAEPLSHYTAPPSAEPRTTEAAHEAMSYVFFHWGLHAWAIYVVMGLGVAYFHFRHQLPLAPRSLLYPLVGERIRGPIGHGVDVLCTVGTLLGVATSLGLGAMQINTGITEYFAVPATKGVQVVIIACITVVATLSVVSGLRAGIRRLSQLNLILALLLFGFVLFAGPTVHLLETFVGSLGLYLQGLPKMSLWVEFAEEGDWQARWTLFYWGWWISWSPFVGIFVARISRGRTIREFVVSVLFLPALATFAWLAVFGGNGLYQEMEQGKELSATVEKGAALSLHAMLENMPFPQVTMALATLVVIIFFITSSDSGSLVDDMVTSGGHPDPPRAQRVFWAVSEGAVAITLLVVGGLRAMQNASITMGLPMSVLLVASCVALYKALSVDEKVEGPPKTRDLAN